MCVMLFLLRLLVSRLTTHQQPASFCSTALKDKRQSEGGTLTFIAHNNTRFSPIVKDIFVAVKFQLLRVPQEGFEPTT